MTLELKRIKSIIDEAEKYETGKSVAAFFNKKYGPDNWPHSSPS